MATVARAFPSRLPPRFLKQCQKSTGLQSNARIKPLSDQKHSAIKLNCVPVASSTIVQELVEYLEADLPRLFEKGEVDETRFEDEMNFEDPITKYDSLGGYLFNIKLLLLLFEPVFLLHSTIPTGPHEITTRWTMTMDFKLLPWRPQIVFTGLSIYGINPLTGKFNSHVDIWDSISDQKHFSIEGLKDLLKQSSQSYTRLDVFSPEYTVLVRRDAYEIREYKSFSAVELSIPNSQNLLQSIETQLEVIQRLISEVNRVSNLILRGLPVILQKTPRTNYPSMRVPVKFIKADGENSFRMLLKEDFEVVEVPNRIVASIRFGGVADEVAVESQERELRNALKRDNIRVGKPTFIAVYNVSNFAPIFNRNEIFVEVEDFKWEVLDEKNK